MGSTQSTLPGRPVLTSQKPQLRVQVSPRRRNEAVRNSPQHSPIFGQAASSQMVWSPCSRMSFLSSLKCGPCDKGTFNHSGRRPITGGAVSGDSGCARGVRFKTGRLCTSVQGILYGFELALEFAEELQGAGAVQDAVV